MLHFFLCSSFFAHDFRCGDADTLLPILFSEDDGNAVDKYVSVSFYLVIGRFAFFVFSVFAWNGGHTYVVSHLCVCVETFAHL